MSICHGLKLTSSPVISAVSDFTLAAFPILLLHKVHISMSIKIKLCLLMGLGVM